MRKNLNKIFFGIAVVAAGIIFLGSAFGFWEISELSGLEIKAAKRNGRKQQVHLMIARGNKAVLNAVGEGNAGNAGAPTKEQMIKEYAAMHPEMSNRQLAIALGVSRNTVNKWLKN